MQSTNNSQRSNYLLNSSSQKRRARIFDKSQSSEGINNPSIIPISNRQINNSPPIQTEEFNMQGLQESQVSELQIHDLNKVNQFKKMPDLSRCKVKFVKKENKSTQTGTNDKDIIIRQQEALINQLQHQIQQQSQSNMEFSFHKENMDQQLQLIKSYSGMNNQTNSNNVNNSLMTNSPYKNQSKQQQNHFYFTAIPQSNNKSYILKPQNIDKLVVKHTKQKSNKDYFFSQMD